MRVAVRLIKRWDLDLIMLQHGNVPLKDILREALYAYVRGETIRVAVPAVPRRALDEVCEKKKNKAGNTVLLPVRVDVAISDEKSIHILEGARSACGNTFLKELLRASIVNLPLSHYLVDETEATAKAKRLSKDDHVSVRQIAQKTAEFERPVRKLISELCKKEEAEAERLLSDPTLYRVINGILVPPESNTGDTDVKRRKKEDRAVPAPEMSRPKKRAESVPQPEKQAITADDEAKKPARPVTAPPNSIEDDDDDDDDGWHGMSFRKRFGDVPGVVSEVIPDAEDDETADDEEEGFNIFNSLVEEVKRRGS